MSKLTKKFATASITVATVVSLAGMSVAPVGAVTIAELQAQIAVLTAQLAAMSGNTSTTTCYVWNGSLTLGSTGPDVTTLQNFLTGTGHFTFTGGATGYFGPITQAAVAAWQAANGVAPAVGYWGPISQAKYNTMCGDTADDDDDDTDSDDLEGGAGSILDTDLDSGLNNEEVGEGEEDVEVAGLEIEVDEGSDIELTAVTLNFDTGTEDGSDNAFNDFEDYADEVSVWFDGEEVARVDGDSFNDDNNYQRTVSLDDGAVIRAEETGELTVAISAVSNLDSVDVTDEWTVDFTQFRFRDAQDASVTETVTENARTFSFESFATATDLEFKISSGDAAINDARVLDIDADDDTQGVELFAFDVEIEGDSDVELKDLQLTATMAGTANLLSEMFSDLSLEMDGEVIASENAPAHATDLVFDDVDTMLEAGETYSFVLVGDVLELSATLVNGDNVSWAFGETETDDADFDAEDEDGENLADADKTGSASSEAHAVYDAGIMVEFVSATSDDNPDLTAGSIDEDGSYTIVFDVTAFDGDVYIPFLADPTALDAGDAFGVGYTVTDGTLTTTATEDLDSDGDNDGSNAFLVEEGETDRFTLTVTLTATTGTVDYASIAINGIGWGTADITTSTNDFNFNLDEFEAGPESLTAF